MRVATAEWADPAQVETQYAYRDGTVWLGRSGSENQVPLGYRDDRHVCLVSGSRGGKGSTSIVNNLILCRCGEGHYFVFDHKPDEQEESDRK
jgi:type IV secretory pathway TraG/TraD family ATPase VirD4